jgi:hypothetical protein
MESMPILQRRSASYIFRCGWALTIMIWLGLQFVCIQSDHFVVLPPFTDNSVISLLFAGTSMALRGSARRQRRLHFICLLII